VPDVDAKSAPPASPSPGERVLVVDDDEAVLELANEFLRRAGYRTQGAAGGVEAMDLFRSQSDDIDVVVLDLMMPDMDGREVFRALRQLRSDLPVVLTTGYSESVLQEGFANESHLQFLRKPYEPEQLIDAVREAIGDEKMDRGHD
jgi:CheY-like chemotaxis protein